MKTGTLWLNISWQISIFLSRLINLILFKSYSMWMVREIRRVSDCHICRVILMHRGDGFESNLCFHFRIIKNHILYVVSEFLWSHLCDLPVAFKSILPLGVDAKSNVNETDGFDFLGKDFFFIRAVNFNRISNGNAVWVIRSLIINYLTAAGILSGFDKICYFF